MVSHEKLSKEDFTMNDLKNSETVKNLMRAFAGESQARNRYTFAASQAKKRDFLSSRPSFPIQQARRKSMRRFFIIT